MPTLPEHDTRCNGLASLDHKAEERRADLAEAAKIAFPAALEDVKREVPNMEPKAQEQLAMMRARRIAGAIIEKPAPIAAPTASRPAPAPPAEPKTAEVIQLSFWGEDYRAAPNAVFRSALFPALNPKQKETRRFLKNEDVFCVAGLKVIFTGEQFDQSDLDVYLELLNMAQPFPLGTPVKFSAHALLKALGLTTGGDNHARLHEVLIRLCGGVADINDHGKSYFGQLLHGGMRDKITAFYTIKINPEFAVLFGYGMYSKIDLEKRRALGRNNTAKALYNYYATHISPKPHSIETIANLAGLTNSNKRQTKAAIIKAHEAMKAAGCLLGFTVLGDSIKAELNPNPSQRRAILKTATKPTPRRKKTAKVGDLLPGILDPKKGT